MFQIITGYRTTANLNSPKMLKLMESLKKQIEKKWKEIYLDLISDEVNVVADYYVLKNLTINPDHSILDVATERVCNRIARSSQMDVFTRYNFRIILEIVPYMSRWYILVVTNNPLLKKNIFTGIKDIEPFHVYRSEIPTEAEKIWDNIRVEFTTKNIPFRQNYFPPLPLSIDPAELKFQNKAERAYYQAVSTERTQILSALSLENTIPPQEVIRYIDEVDVERDASEEHDEQIKERTAQLTRILPELTIELITKKRGKNEPIIDETKAMEESRESQNDTPHG